MCQDMTRGGFTPLLWVVAFTLLQYSAEVTTLAISDTGGTETGPPTPETGGTSSSQPSTEPRENLQAGLLVSTTQLPEEAPRHIPDALSTTTLSAQTASLPDSTYPSLEPLARRSTTNSDRVTISETTSYPVSESSAVSELSTSESLTKRVTIGFSGTEVRSSETPSSSSSTSSSSSESSAVSKELKNARDDLTTPSPVSESAGISKTHEGTVGSSLNKLTYVPTTVTTSISSRSHIDTKLLANLDILDKHFMTSANPILDSSTAQGSTSEVQPTDPGKGLTTSSTTSSTIADQSSLISDSPLLDSSSTPGSNNSATNDSTVTRNTPVHLFDYVTTFSASENDARNAAISEKNTTMVNRSSEEVMDLNRTAISNASLIDDIQVNEFGILSNESDSVNVTSSSPGEPSLQPSHELENTSSNVSYSEEGENINNTTRMGFGNESDSSSNSTESSNSTITMENLQIGNTMGNVSSSDNQTLHSIIETNPDEDNYTKPEPDVASSKNASMHGIRTDERVSNLPSAKNTNSSVNLTSPIDTSESTKSHNETDAKFINDSRRLYVIQLIDQITKAHKQGNESSNASTVNPTTAPIVQKKHNKTSISSGLGNPSVSDLLDQDLLEELPLASVEKNASRTATIPVTEDGNGNATNEANKVFAGTSIFVTDGTDTSTFSTETLETSNGSAMGMEDADIEYRIAGIIRIIHGAHWTPELEDRTSTQFKLLATNLKEQLDMLYQKGFVGEHLKEIEIEGFSLHRHLFSEGSVVVMYNLVFSTKSDLLTPDNLKELVNGGLKNGNLGEYQLDMESTKFKTPWSAPPNPLELSGEPPIPQWAIAVIVVAAACLIFSLLFAAVTVYGRGQGGPNRSLYDKEGMLDSPCPEWERKMAAAYENMAADNISEKEGHRRRSLRDEPLRRPLERGDSIKSQLSVRKDPESNYKMDT